MALVPQVYLDLELFIQSRLLEDDPHFLADRDPVPREVHAEHTGFARFAGIKGGKDLEGSGLAPAVWAQKAEYLSPAHREGERIEGVLVAVAVGEVFDFNGVLQGFTPY